MAEAPSVNDCVIQPAAGRPAIAASRKGPGHQHKKTAITREFQFSLLRGLDADQRRELAGRFAGQLSGAERLPCTLVLHRGSQDGQIPHVHLMFSERSITSEERRLSFWYFLLFVSVAGCAGAYLRGVVAASAHWLLEVVGFR